MAGYLGASPVPQSIQKKESFTATASQTTFNTTGYTDGNFINVYLNGVRLINGTDYTATNGSDIVLTSAASASDVLDFETFNEFTLVDQTLETPTFRTSATLKNDTEEDTDGGRESTLIFKGEQSGGEISTLAEIEASHDGTSDDEKGDLIFRTNDGNDGTSPTERLRINSAGDMLFSSDDPSLTIANTTHEDTDGGRESTIVFQGEQSGGEVSTLAEIEASHDGAADDQKGDLIFRTNDGSDGSSPTEAARIDSDQNLLVGLSAVQSTGTAVGFQVASGTTGSTADGSPAGIFARKTSDGDIVTFRKDTTTVGKLSSFSGVVSSLILDPRSGGCGIQGAGALLVGTTTSRPAEFSHPDGFAIRGDVTGQIQNTVTDANCALFNRDGTDGAILGFRKEGTDVGSIGADGSAPYFATAVGSTLVGIKMQGGSTPRINPTDGNGDSTDGIATIGFSSSRFKDLYLSGGVYLGGTAAANHLEDYEEGSWTPSVGTGSISGTAQGTYTKVGNSVTVRLYLQGVTNTTSSNNLEVTGLPFTAVGTSTMDSNAGSLMIRYIDVGITEEIGTNSYVSGGATAIRFFAQSAGGNYVSITHASITSTGIGLRATVEYSVS